MSAERHAARAEALARVAAAHRPLAEVIADLRRETGGAGETASSVVAAEPTGAPVEQVLDAPAEQVVDPAVAQPEPAVAQAEPAVAQAEPAAAEDAPPAVPDRHAEALRTVEEAWAAGRVARQRFGEPYCPAPVCYGRDYRVLDPDVVGADFVPPYAADCNCTVIVD